MEACSLIKIKFALSDIGSHSINLLSILLRKNQKFIVKKFSEHKKDDNGFIILKINNILCNIHFSFVRWKNKFSLKYQVIKDMLNSIS